MKWNRNEVSASKFAYYWRVLYMKNWPGKVIKNASISVGNRNAPTFGLILTITTWLRIYKLTTGSCDVRHAIGTNFCEDKELVEFIPQIGHRKEFKSWLFERKPFVKAIESSRWPIYAINSVDNTNLHNLLNVWFTVMKTLGGGF